MSGQPVVQDISVSYPAWMRHAIVIGTATFFGLALALVYVELELLQKSWIALILLVAPLKVFHLGMIGFSLFPFLRSTFTATTKGVRITFPDGRFNDYSWDDIGPIKDRYVMQVFEMRSHTGTLICALDYYSPNLRAFKERVMNHARTRRG